MRSLLLSGENRRGLESPCLAEGGALIVEEEKSFIAAIVELGNVNGAADEAAEIIVVEYGLFAAQSTLPPGISIEVVILKVFEKLAMKSVPAGARNHFHKAAGNAAVLSRKSVRD